MKSTATCVIALSMVIGVLAQAPAIPPRDRVAPERTGTGRISGRVISADSTNPLMRASVEIYSTALKEPRRLTTDENGRYDASGLPAGRYTIRVSRLGYVALEYGQTRLFESGRELELLDGQTLDRIDFALSHGGVITGRITDQNGEPLPGIRMNALRYTWSPSGARQLQPTGQNFFTGILTDDLGEFRLYGLTPASYVVAAGATPGMFSGPEQDGLGATYFPGTANADEAQAVDVEAGRETPVHFALVPTRLARLSGMVVDSTGQPVGGRSLMLGTKTESSMSSRSVGMTLKDGSFVIPSVPPGNYTIDVRPPRPAAGNIEFASFPVSVEGRDIGDLTIWTRPGATVTGRVVWEGSSPEPFASLRIEPTAADSRSPGDVVAGGAGNGVVDTAGSFRISGVHGNVIFRHYFTGRAEPWNLKAIRLGSTDITDVGLDVSADVEGLEVVMTDRQTSVSGIVRDGQRKPAMNYVVVFLPAEVKPGVVPTRFIRAARPNQQGRYDERALPPGQYVAVAVESLTRDGHYNPAFQKRVRSAGTPVTVKEGQNLTLDLDLLP